MFWILHMHGLRACSARYASMEALYFVVGYQNIQVSTQCNNVLCILIYLFVYTFLFFNKDGGIINTHSLDIVVYIICDSIISCLSFVLQYLHTNVQRCMSAWNRDAGW